MIISAPSIIESNRGLPADTHVQAFLSIALITDPVITNALEWVVWRAKTRGWWDICTAIWPIAGGLAAAHTFNIKDARDLDAAYRLTFTGGWTHSATGMLPNGSTGRADTHMNPNTVLLLNDTHISAYLRTDTSGTSGFKTEMCSSGVGGAAPSLTLTVKTKDTFDNRVECTIGDTASSGGAIDFNPNLRSDGYYSLSRTSSILMTLCRNGGPLSTNTNTQAAASLPTVNLTIGSTNQAGTFNSFTDREFAFITVGKGKNLAMEQMMYEDIQMYQTLLSRQV